MKRKGHVEEVHANSERWLLTYADLITLLLVFFVVMYSISVADKTKFSRLNASLSKAFGGLVLQGDDKTAVGSDAGAMSGNSIMDDFFGMQNQINQVKADMGLQSQINVGLQKEGISISLSGSLLFDSGRAELRPESTRALDGIANSFRNMPNNVRVEGHTDNVRVNSDLYPTNWELSTARATAVTRYLNDPATILYGLNIDAQAPESRSTFGAGLFSRG